MITSRTADYLPPSIAKQLIVAGTARIVVPLGHSVPGRRLRLPKAGFVDLPRVMIRDLLFVFLDLPIAPVDQRVNRGVHVGVDRVGVDCTTPQMNGGLGLMDEFFDGQDAVNVGHVVKMALELSELRPDVIT
jgi:hypothetical protein